MSKRILFVAAALFFIAAGFVMRQNYLQAQKLALAVLTVDHSGIDPTAQLATLKTYTSTHMIGVSVKVFLSDGFDRAEAAARATAAATAANAQVYADAQRACSGKSDSIVQARCNQDYLNKHLVALPPAGPVSQPNSADFLYTFAPKIWYPDLAGALIVGGIVALGLAIFGGRRRQKRGY